MSLPLSLPPVGKKRKLPVDTSIPLTAGSPDASGEVPSRGVNRFFGSVCGGDNTSRRLAEAVSRGQKLYTPRRSARCINAAASPSPPSQSATTDRTFEISFSEEVQVRAISPRTSQLTESPVYTVQCPDSDADAKAVDCPICAVPADEIQAFLDSRYFKFGPLEFPDATTIVLYHAQQYANSLGRQQKLLRDGFAKAFLEFKSKLVNAKFDFVCADNKTVNPTATIQKLDAVLDTVYAAVWRHLNGAHCTAVAMQP